MSDWVRTGPGQYKNKKTGQVLKGQATDPNKNPKYNKPAAAAPQPTTPAPAPAPQGGAPQPAAPQPGPDFPLPSRPGISDVVGDFDLRPGNSARNASAFMDAQGEQNRRNAADNVRLNRVNESNSFGSRTYNADGSISDTLSPGQQGLFDAQTQTGTTGARVANSLVGGMPGQYNAESLNQYLPQGSDAARQQSYDATYGQLTRDLEKNRGKDKEQLEQRLADQGIPVGSKLYNDQMQQLNQRYDDQQLAARNQSVVTGADVFGQSFNMGQTNYQNRFGAYNSNYTMPASVAAQLQGLGQVQAPQFGQGFVPVEQQNIDLSGFYDTASSVALRERELALAERQQQRSGGGGGGRSFGGRVAGQAQQQFPDFTGGVAGAGVATNRPPRNNPVRNVGNSVVTGVTQAGVVNLTR